MAQNIPTLTEASETAIHQCMALREDESCLIVTDDNCKTVASSLYQVASEVTPNTQMITYPPLDLYGDEPPDPVAAAMRVADVILAPTSQSLSHANATSDAIEAGARVSTLPGITEGIFRKGLLANYTEIQECCDRLHQKVSEAISIQIVSDNGTDITFQLDTGVDWGLDTGIIHEAGEFSNLPTGEIYTTPVTAEGKFVIDGSMPPVGLVDEPISFEVEDGYVTSISNERVASEIKKAAEKAGKDTYTVAEIGIGANVGVSDLTGNVLLDEKSAGTVHIAVGDNHAIGGDSHAPIHLDGVIRDPQVIVDGQIIELPPNS